MEKITEYSLVDTFGELPVHPDVFATLCPRLKWLGKAVEGESWCTSCGTLSPKIPRTHHHNCDAFLNADEHEVRPNPLGCCPKCRSEDSLMIDSSREQGLSVIHCCDCTYNYSRGVDEETLTEMFLSSRHHCTKRNIENGHL